MARAMLETLRGLTKLQTENFTFIDMAGGVTRGRDGWPSYFSAYPKCKIRVQHVLTGGNSVAVIGKPKYSDIEEAKKKAKESHQEQ